MEGPNLILKASLPDEEPELSPRELLLLEERARQADGGRVGPQDRARQRCGAGHHRTHAAGDGRRHRRRRRPSPAGLSPDRAADPQRQAARHRGAVGVGRASGLHRRQRPAERADGAAGQAPHGRPGRDPERHEPVRAVHGLRLPGRRDGGRHHRGIRAQGAGRTARGDRRGAGARRRRRHGARRRGRHAAGALAGGDREHPRTDGGRGGRGRQGAHGARARLRRWHHDVRIRGRAGGADRRDRRSPSCAARPASSRPRTRSRSSPSTRTAG